MVISILMAVIVTILIGCLIALVNKNIELEGDLAIKEEALEKAKSLLEKAEKKLKDNIEYMDYLKEECAASKIESINSNEDIILPKVKTKVRSCGKKHERKKRLTGEQWGQIFYLLDTKELSRKQLAEHYGVSYIRICQRYAEYKKQQK